MWHGLDVVVLDGMLSRGDDGRHWSSHWDVSVMNGRT